MPHNAAVGGSSSGTSASSAECTGYLSSGIGRKTKFGAIKLPPPSSLPRSSPALPPPSSHRTKPPYRKRIQ